MEGSSDVMRGLMREYNSEQEKKSEHELVSEKSVVVTLERKREIAISSSAATGATAASATSAPRVLVRKEESLEGSVKMDVYVSWLRGFGWGSLSVVTLSLLAFGIQGFLDYFISFWVSNTFNLSSTTYLWIYSLLAVVSMLFYVSYLVGFWAYALRAARALHDLALDRLLRARVSWFESVPSGRILNRFSKDVDVVDQALPDSFKVFFGNVVQLLMFVVVISVAFPYFLVVVVPVTFLFFYITLYFNRTNRQVRRLEGVLRSPVFSDMSTLLTGLQTLRIYNQTEDFAKRLITRIDRFSSSVFMYWTLTRWLSARLDLLCALLVLASSTFSVGLKGTLPPSFAAIAITYSLRMGSFLQWTFRNLSLMESSAVSAERLIEYADDIPQEPQGGWEDIPADWPSRGKIEVQNASLRYAPDLPPSLRYLSLTVLPGQRVGIVGRTGAGKSTFASALFRLRELDTGVIRIDGLDISQLSLRLLRSRLSIITQEPVLFQGSLRFNLDPFDEHSNEELWAVLQRVGLAELANANGGLEWAVQDGGQNLSAGERQVVCLARVLLRPSKVVVLDEATSNVDSRFDNLIQSVIRSSDFASSTVLCIAHRLNTIIDSDRILVLDKGEAVEYDHPAALVRQPSLFRDLLLDTGGETSSALIKTATMARIDQREEERETEGEHYYNSMETDFEVFKMSI